MSEEEGEIGRNIWGLAERHLDYTHDSSLAEDTRHGEDARPIGAASALHDMQMVLLIFAK